jgi:hypothetical protein
MSLIATTLLSEPPLRFAAQRRETGREATK